MAWVAISCVALRAPTVLWSGIVFCMTLILLAMALLAIIYRRRRFRAFGVGFVVVGLAYAVCLFLSEHNFTATGLSPQSEIPTTRLARWLFEKLHSQSVQTVTVPAGSFGGGGMVPMTGTMPGMPGVGGTVSYSQMLYDSTNFTAIVHCTLALLLGVIGGIMAQFHLAADRLESEQVTRDTP